MDSLSRVLLVDKPAGPTSFDMVRLARRGFGRRVGHAGTLDPFATGLLLVLTGQATRLSGLLMALHKEYEMTIQFGWVSSTGDPTGDISPSGGLVDGPAVLAALGRFRGEIVQKVPMTSAVKVDGEALYKKAHRGETAETPERTVTVYSLDLLEFDHTTQTARVTTVTSSGTYLRVLAEDVGAALGVGAYASTLRRTRIGRFSVGGAVDPVLLSPDLYREGGRGVFSIDAALASIPEIELMGPQARLAANGNVLRIELEGRARIYGEQRLLGVYEGREGTARPLIVFPPEACRV